MKIDGADKKESNFSLHIFMLQNQKSYKLQVNLQNCHKPRFRSFFSHRLNIWKEFEWREILKNCCRSRREEQLCWTFHSARNHLFDFQPSTIFTTLLWTVFLNSTPSRHMTAQNVEISPIREAISPQSKNFIFSDFFCQNHSFRILKNPRENHQNWFVISWKVNLFAVLLNP